MRLLIWLATCAAVWGADQISEPTQRVDATYRLFRTQNIFNFLRLDTRTGRVWQVQWNKEAESRLVLWINSFELDLPGGEPINERKAVAGTKDPEPSTEDSEFATFDEYERAHLEWRLKRVPGGQRGRFTLYPTENVYTFLLLDQEDGRMWQIQWGTSGTGSRLIRPICESPKEPKFLSCVNPEEVKKAGK